LSIALASSSGEGGFVQEDAKKSADIGKDLTVVLQEFDDIRETAFVYRAVVIPRVFYVGSELLLQLLYRKSAHVLAFIHFSFWKSKMVALLLILERSNWG
jgi:hypothetical protein